MALRLRNFLLIGFLLALELTSVSFAQDLTFEKDLLPATPGNSSVTSPFTVQESQSPRFKIFQIYFESRLLSVVMVSHDGSRVEVVDRGNRKTNITLTGSPLLDENGSLSRQLLNQIMNYAGDTLLDPNDVVRDALSNEGQRILGMISLTKMNLNTMEKNIKKQEALIKIGEEKLATLKRGSEEWLILNMALSESYLRLAEYIESKTSVWKNICFGAVDVLTFTPRFIESVMLAASVAALRVVRYTHLAQVTEKTFLGLAPVGRAIRGAPLVSHTYHAVSTSTQAVVKIVNAIKITERLSKVPKLEKLLDYLLPIFTSLKSIYHPLAKRQLIWNLATNFSGEMFERGTKAFTTEKWEFIQDMAIGAFFRVARVRLTELPNGADKRLRNILLGLHYSLADRFITELRLRGRHPDKEVDDYLSKRVDQNLLWGFTVQPISSNAEDAALSFFIAQQRAHPDKIKELLIAESIFRATNKMYYTFLNLVVRRKATGYMIKPANSGHDDVVGDTLRPGPLLNEKEMGAKSGTKDRSWAKETEVSSRANKKPINKKLRKRRATTFYKAHAIL